MLDISSAGKLFQMSYRGRRVSLANGATNAGVCFVAVSKVKEERKNEGREAKLLAELRVRRPSMIV